MSSSPRCVDVTVDNWFSMPVTTKAQPGAEGVDSVIGVKYHQVTIFNKMQNSAETLGKC